MEQIIAERKIWGKRSNSEKVPITIKIGEPYESEAGSWACPVALDGLHAKLADIHGVDSFQALMLTHFFGSGQYLTILYHGVYILRDVW